MIAFEPDKALADCDVTISGNDIDLAILKHGRFLIAHLHDRQRAASFKDSAEVADALRVKVLR